MRPWPGKTGGFTLLEVLLALGIVAVLMVILTGGMRVGLAAWQRGEERTAQLDRARGLVVVLDRALAGAFPYRAAPATETEPRILFDGQPDRIVFATLAPPRQIGAPTAFSAVMLAADATGLTMRQQSLPNELALELLAPILVDRQTTAVRFRYLGQEPDAWLESWDMSKQEALPRAVEITLLAGTGLRRTPQTLTVPIRTTTP
jgi:general secretion pathway protein J